MIPFVTLGIIIVICLLIITISIILFVSAAGGWNTFEISSISHLFGTKFNGLGQQLIEFDNCKFRVQYRYKEYPLIDETKDVTFIMNQIARSNYNSIPFQKDKPQQNVYLDPLTPLSFLQEDSLGNILYYPGIDNKIIAKKFDDNKEDINNLHNFGIYKINTKTNINEYCTVEQLGKLKEKILRYKKDVIENDKDKEAKNYFDIAYICTLTGKIKQAVVEPKSITNKKDQDIYPIRFNSYGSVFEYKCPVVCDSPDDISCIECSKRCYNFSGDTPIGLSDYFPNNCGCSYKTTCQKETSIKDCYKMATPYNIDKTAFTDAPFSWDENADFTELRGPNILTDKEIGENKIRYEKQFSQVKDDKGTVVTDWPSYKDKGIVVTFEPSGFLEKYKIPVFWKSTNTETLKCFNPLNYKFIDGPGGYEKEPNQNAKNCHSLYKYLKSN